MATKAILQIMLSRVPRAQRTSKTRLKHCAAPSLLSNSAKSQSLKRSFGRTVSVASAQELRGRLIPVRPDPVRLRQSSVKEHAEAALFTLVEVASGKCAASARVSAAIAILDRAYGKPPQALEHSTMVEDPLAQLLRELSGSSIRPVE